MKQVQYRRAAQSTGFRPVQISGNEIARMREESARVVQGMRDVRDAEIRQREAKLADEKEAQRLEARLRDKNRQIETANHQRTLTGLQQEARAKDQQFRQTQQDNAQILQSISTISESAGKAYTQYIEAEEDKTIAEELEKYIANPDDEILDTLRNEGYLDVLDEMEQSKLDEYEARGGDPVVVAKGRNFSNRVRREILKGKAAYFYEYKYSQILDEAIQTEENRLGRPMDSAELAGYMTEVGGVVADRFRNQGGMTLKPGSMRAALESRERIHMARLTAKRSEEVKNQNQMTLDNATSILTTNPRDFEKNIIQSFQMVRRANGNDYAKAHDWYVTLATMQDANGKFLFTTEQLAGTVLQAGEKPYAQQRPGRFSAILMARMEADNAFRKKQINADKLAYQEAENNALKYIVASDGSKEVVEQAVGMFRDTYGKVPKSIQTYLENYTVEAQAKAKQVEQLQAMPDGFILKEHVDALKRLDSKAGGELEKRYAAQEAKYNSGIYKTQSDSFKTIANKVTKIGTQGPNTPASVFLQQEMRAEYRKRVDIAATGGLDFNTAANSIAIELAKEVEAGYLDPNSKWYRKVSAAGGAADFPNLNQGNLTALEKSRRNYQAIVKSIGNNGLEKTLDTAESILTREEIVSIVNEYGKPGFVVPTDVLAVSTFGNGLDPFTIINRQIAALGDPKLLPLEPPAIIKSINSTMTEQQRNDLFNVVNGPMQRLRSLQQVAQTVAQPSNLRAGFAGNSLKRSFTDALTYEGNRGAYQQTGQALQQLGFKVAEHPDFGGVAPVHAGNSFHGYGEAFDITHQTGDYDTSIEKTRQLKELIRSMNLFKEVIGPGDGDPAHTEHLHLGGLMRPLTAEDIEILNSFN
jgi:hypothetical protein